MSSEVRSEPSRTFKFSISLSLLLLLGTTSMPCCVAQRSRTWAGADAYITFVRSVIRLARESRLTLVAARGDFGDDVMLQKVLRALAHVELVPSERTEGGVGGYGQVEGLGEV